MQADLAPCRICQRPAELGQICRPCWLKSGEARARESSRALYRLHDLRSDIMDLSESDAVDLATLLLGGKTRSPLGGRAAQLVSECRQVLDGPFGPNLKAILEGVQANGLPKRAGSLREALS
jgi:hypothetical protein